MGQIMTRQSGREWETMGIARHECVSRPANAHLQYDQSGDMPIGRGDKGELVSW